MFEQLTIAMQHLRQVVAGFEPELVDGTRARELVEAFGEVERLGAAGKALAAVQVVATGSWKHDGAHRDAADWLAAATGATVGSACGVLETAARLESLPAVDAAFRAGALSGAEAEVIADAASVDPHAESALLERARHDGIRGLRTEGARVKAAACVDEMARYERVRASRSFRHWTDTDGAGCIGIRGPVDQTARVLAALAPYEKDLFDAAGKAGREERSDALAFDALIALADAARPAVDDTKAAASRPATTAVLRIDHASLIRGHTEPGEVCEIVGSGPIPVAVASKLLDDAFIKAVLVDGTDVLAVSHLGRTIPARLRTAIEELYSECVLEGCHVAENLEIDHNVPIEEGGRTELCNLGRLCGHHHHYKHKHGLRLVGEGTNQRFVKPDPRRPPDPTDPDDP